MFSFLELNTLEISGYNVENQHKPVVKTTMEERFIKPSVLIVAANFKCKWCFYLCGPFVSLFIDFLFVCRSVCVIKAAAVETRLKTLWFCCVITCLKWPSVHWVKWERLGENAAPRGPLNVDTNAAAKKVLRWHFLLSLCFPYFSLFLMSLYSASTPLHPSELREGWCVLSFLLFLTHINSENQQCI